jgi:hypothetical protein
MNITRIILLCIAGIGLHGALYAQDIKKEHKIRMIWNFSMGAEMGNLDNFFPEFSLRVEPIQKKYPVHWYAQGGMIFGAYTTYEPDSTVNLGITGGVSIHPPGHVFIGIGGGTYLLSEEGKKKFFWGFTPHIGVETMRHKFTLGFTILQKRTDGVDVISFTFGRKFYYDDE